MSFNEELEKLDGRRLLDTLVSLDDRPEDKSELEERLRDRYPGLFTLMQHYYCVAGSMDLDCEGTYAVAESVSKILFTLSEYGRDEELNSQFSALS